MITFSNHTQDEKNKMIGCCQNYIAQLSEPTWDEHNLWAINCLMICAMKNIGWTKVKAHLGTILPQLDRVAEEFDVQ
jgi:hypothetical protein